MTICARSRPCSELIASAREVRAALLHLKINSSFVLFHVSGNVGSSVVSSINHGFLNTQLNSIHATVKFMTVTQAGWTRFLKSVREGHAFFFPLAPPSPQYGVAKLHPMAWMTHPSRTFLASFIPWCEVTEAAGKVRNSGQLHGHSVRKIPIHQIYCKAHVEPIRVTYRRRPADDDA